MRNQFWKQTAVLLLGFQSSIAFSAIGTEQVPVTSSAFDIEAAVQNLEKKLDEVKAKARAKAKAFHRLNSQEYSLRHPWEKADSKIKVKNGVERLLEIALKEDLRIIEKLEEQLESMRGDQSLGRIETEPSDIKLSNKIKINHCKAAPFELIPEAASLQMIQDFGLRKDPETGIEWPSSGWWVSNVQKDIKACADGVIAFDGDVAGRGRVVIVDHGDGNMTLYGNLVPQPSDLIKKGVKVKSGTILGQSSFKVYFEVRKNGVAVNPRQFLSSKVLSQLHL